MHVIVEITDKCNNRCPYCYSPNISNRFMSLSEFDRLLSIMKKEVTTEILVLSGGEPTLHPELTDMIRLARSKYHFPRVGLITNGKRLVDIDFCRHLLESGLSAIQLSIESHKEGAHDEQVGVRGSWRKTVAGLKNVESLAPHLLGINITLTRLNIDYVSETFDFLYGLGVREISCNQCTNASRAIGDSDDLSVSDAVVLTEFDLVKSVAAERWPQLRVELRNSFDLCELPPDRWARDFLKGAHYPCSVGRHLMEIDCHGNLAFCGLFHENVGNIFEEGSIMSLWFSERMSDFRLGIFGDPRCVDCADLAFCGGTCPARGCGNLLEKNSVTTS